MKLVIDISEEDFVLIRSVNNPNLLLLAESRAMLAVKNGKPLPEHHGRLGDLDALYKEMKNGIKAGNYENGYEDYGHINNMDDCLEAVKYAETIIPATEEGD